jgi:hypothetical protein
MSGPTPDAPLHVAITGASGLIGTALSARLESLGHTVRPVVRRDAADHEIPWNPAEGIIEPRDFAGLDGVIHLAGAGIFDRRWNARHKQMIRDSRTRGTALLAEALAALQSPPPVLLSGSAVGYYGDRAGAALDETSPAGTGFLADVVVAWEAAAAMAVQAGIRTCFLRTGIVMSRSGGALKTQLPLFKMGLGGRLGGGEQYLAWIGLTDIIDAIIHLLGSQVRGPVNLVGPTPVTNGEFTDVLGDVVRRPTVIPIPRFGPKLLLGGEMADELLFTSQRVVPQVLLDDGFTFTHPTVADALHAELD